MPLPSPSTFPTTGWSLPPPTAACSAAPTQASAGPRSRPVCLPPPSTASKSRCTSPRPIASTPAVEGQGVFVSFDRGVNWQNAGPDGLTDLNLQGLHIARGPAGTDELVVWTEQTVFRSIGPDTSWVNIGADASLPAFYVPLSAALSPRFAKRRHPIHRDERARYLALHQTGARAGPTARRQRPTWAPCIRSWSRPTSRRTARFGRPPPRPGPCAPLMPASASRQTPAACARPTSGRSAYHPTCWSIR